VGVCGRLGVERLGKNLLMGLLPRAGGGEPRTSPRSVGQPDLADNLVHAVRGIGARAVRGIYHDVAEYLTCELRALACVVLGWNPASWSRTTPSSDNGRRARARGLDTARRAPCSRRSCWPPRTGMELDEERLLSEG